MRFSGGLTKLAISGRDAANLFMKLTLVSSTQPLEKPSLHVLVVVRLEQSERFMADGDSKTRVECGPLPIVGKVNFSLQVKSLIHVMDEVRENEIVICVVSSPIFTLNY
jgi:hypothetical protein